MSTPKLVGYAVIGLAYYALLAYMLARSAFVCGYLLALIA